MVPEVSTGQHIGSLLGIFFGTSEVKEHACTEFSQNFDAHKFRLHVRHVTVHLGDSSRFRPIPTDECAKCSTEPKEEFPSCDLYLANPYDNCAEDVSVLLFFVCVAG